MLGTIRKVISLLSLTVKFKTLPLVRVTALLATVALVSLFLSLQSLKAQVGKSMLSVGNQLIHYINTKGKLEPEVISINNQKFIVASGTTDDSVNDVARYFEETCLSPSPHEKVRHTKSKPIPSLSERNDFSSSVACLVPTRASTTFGDWKDHLSKFSKTRDVSSLGQLRYAHIARVGKRTHYVSVSSQGSLLIDALAPRNTRDAPGFDFRELPRPPLSRRIMSASAKSRSEQIVLYQNDNLEIEQLEVRYVKLLSKKGWVAHSFDGQYCAAPTGCGKRLMVEKSNNAFLITITKNEKAGSSVAIVNILKNETNDPSDQPNARF